MAARSWVTSISTAMGVAAGAGAAQLGLGYGLSVVAWVPGTADDSRAVWLASLAWVAWISANSAVLGALCADWLSFRTTEQSAGSAVDFVWKAVMALAGAIGALITVPLVAVPARVALQTNNSAPEFTAGGYAVAGVIVGLVVALAALHARAVAANFVITAVWLWILAVMAVSDGLRTGRGPGTAQLATWQFAQAKWLRGMVNLPSALLMLGVALLIGALAAWPAARRGDHRVGIALSGAAGPVLVAAAYFLAVPGIGGQDQQLSAYVTAPYGVIAGLAGSVLMSMLGTGVRERTRVAQDAHDEAAYQQWQQSMGLGTPTGDTADRPTASGPEPATVRLPGSPAAKQAVPAASARTTADRDLPDDAYASSRAYVSDGADAPTGAATGRAKVGDSQPGEPKSGEPLWPEETKPSTGRGRRPRKGR